MRMKMRIDDIIKLRKEWYLKNEFSDYEEDSLPPFIKLKLETQLSRDTEVIDWMLKHLFQEEVI